MKDRSSLGSMPGCRKELQEGPVTSGRWKILGQLPQSFQEGMKPEACSSGNSGQILVSQKSALFTLPDLW